MKLLLDIKDNKADFVLELLKNLPFVKTQELVPTKAKILADIREAVDEMKLVNEGKSKTRSARKVLDEL